MYFKLEPVIRSGLEKSLNAMVGEGRGIMVVSSNFTLRVSSRIFLQRSAALRSVKLMHEESPFSR